MFLTSKGNHIEGKHTIEINITEKNHIIILYF